VKKFNDFPCRKNVVYSFRIMCSQPRKLHEMGSRVLMSDMNPLFEKLPENFRPLMLQLDKRLSRLNSPNHRRHGQNILFGDGSIKYLKQRCVGVTNDDIFTLIGTQVYKGCEVPSCDADTFLAP